MQLKYAPLSDQQPPRKSGFGRFVGLIDSTIYSHVNGSGTMSAQQKRRLAYTSLAAGSVLSVAVYSGDTKTLQYAAATSLIMGVVGAYFVRGFSAAKEVSESASHPSKNVYELLAVGIVMRMVTAGYACYNTVHFLARQDPISFKHGVFSLFASIAFYLVTPMNLIQKEQGNRKEDN